MERNLTSRASARVMAACPLGPRTLVHAAGPPGVVVTGGLPTHGRHCLLFCVSALRSETAPLLILSPKPKSELGGPGV